MASENESEKRETSADVADEIRRAVESIGDEMPYTVSAGTMRRVADRIEAACKRQEKTYLDQIRDAMNKWGHEKHVAEHAQKPTVGNAAALREAVIKALTLLSVCDWPSGVSLDGVGKVIREIDSALDKPPRNCDVGTAEEQEVRFKRFCESHWDLNKPGSECEGCPLDERVGTECELAWAQTPYEAQEGGAE